MRVSSSASRSGPRRRDTRAALLCLDGRLRGRQWRDPFRMCVEPAGHFCRRAGGWCGAFRADGGGRLQHQGEHPLGMLCREAECRLAAERCAEQVECFDTEIADRGRPWSWRVRPLSRRGVFGRLAEAWHLERDHPVALAQQVMAGCQAHAAGAVQVDQRGALARRHVADAEAVGVDEVFGERCGGGFVPYHDAVALKYRECAAGPACRTVRARPASRPCRRCRGPVVTDPARRRRRCRGSVGSARPHGPGRRRS